MKSAGHTKSRIVASGSLTQIDLFDWVIKFTRPMGKIPDKSCCD